MKRIITAVAVLAIVSGALAFKAKTFNVATVYCTTAALDQCINPPLTGHNLIPYVESTSGVPNPCTGGTLPYVKSGANCVASGSQFFTQVNI